MHRHNPLEEIKNTGIIKITWKDRTCTVKKMQVLSGTLAIHYCYCDDDPALLERDKNGFQLSAFDINSRQIQTLQAINFKETSPAS